jgi:hypothetical protein
VRSAQSVWTTSPVGSLYTVSISAKVRGTEPNSARSWVISMYVTICKVRARVRSGHFRSNWDNLPVHQQGQGADGCVEIGARRTSALKRVHTRRGDSSIGVWACRTSKSIGRCDVPYSATIAFHVSSHFTASLRVSSHFLELSSHLIRVDQHSLVELHFPCVPFRVECSCFCEYSS